MVVCLNTPLALNIEIYFALTFSFIANFGLKYIEIEDTY